MNAVAVPDAEDRYLHALLRAYLDLPDTPAKARPPDRTLARSLFAQDVPLDLVRAAFALASARRACRPPTSPPLQPVRSLHYFLPVLEELRLSNPKPAYLARLLARRSAPLTPTP